jgi:hypothetical protein
MPEKKLGNNPFEGGVNSLIRDTQNTQDVLKEHEEQYTQNTQGKKGQKLPRINMAFQHENLEYLQVMSGFENISITQFVNKLINNDMKNKSKLYSQILKLRSDNENI